MQKWQQQVKCSGRRGTVIAHLPYDALLLPQMLKIEEKHTCWCSRSRMRLRRLTSL